MIINSKNDLLGYMGWIKLHIDLLISTDITLKKFRPESISKITLFIEKEIQNIEQEIEDDFRYTLE